MQRSVSASQLIIEFLETCSEPASFGEIGEWVLPRSRLKGKTPQKTLWAILQKIDAVERVAVGRYSLKK